jgi:hypothetical protein
MTPSPEHAARDSGLGGWLIFSFAVACGITVANVYYAQPLIGSISESFGLDMACLIYTYPSPRQRG